jgi:hypothetical protein
LAHNKGVLSNVSAHARTLNSPHNAKKIKLITFLPISHNYELFVYFHTKISVVDVIVGAIVDVGKKKIQICLIKVLAISDNSEDI